MLTKIGRIGKPGSAKFTFPHQLSFCLSQMIMESQYHPNSHRFPPMCLAFAIKEKKTVLIQTLHQAHKARTFYVRIVLAKCNLPRHFTEVGKCG